ncbi:MAG: Uncharacterized protein XD43_1958 [Thermococcales archaeon 44_46]|uniref:hypothetical protein n=1 Tax=unclassified Thermococcus TaxID=2627626 RepID=UPI0005B26AFC|nr:hypothetical protein [Thermococcus sp. PK]KUJ98376.1 MAG: Uncharacterized protein XD43_1958 [Thermococcales archaeon 44_46]MDK2783700.1 hypothetical protein [Thermococcaceae archaeon]MPW38575.1 hypothetical protein [Thermococcus sp. 101 C5]HIH72230.1 hypothetical protein [Thermococcaceae archaeon]
MIDILGYLLDGSIIILGTILSVAAWKAYRKSGMKSILLLFLAFLMFVSKKIIENFHLIRTSLSSEILEVVSTTFELLILLLFFTALIRRD